MVEISLANRTIPLVRPKLRVWLQSEEIRQSVFDSADKKNSAGFISGIYSFLSLLSGVETTEFATAPWYEVMDAYYMASVENLPTLDLSILSLEKSKTSIPEAWEYPQRLWYAWVHMFGSVYGWTIEYVAQLDVDDAWALAQEIALSEQFSKEWQYSLSEVAYEYEKETNKSKLRPLSRPPWMSTATTSTMNKIKQTTGVKKTRTIPSNLLPKGIMIVDGQNITPTPDSG